MPAMSRAPSMTLVLVEGGTAGSGAVERSIEGELSGYVLRKVSSVDDLLELVRSLPPVPVVILGEEPEGRDGPEALSRVLDGPEVIPVIVLVSEGNDAYGIRAMKAGADSFASLDPSTGTFPALPVLIVSALERALERSRGPAPREDRGPAGIRSPGLPCDYVSPPGYPVREAGLLEMGLVAAGSSDMVVVVDDSGRLTAMNVAAESVAGLQSHECAGRLFTDVFRLVRETDQPWQMKPLDPREVAGRPGVTAGEAERSLFRFSRAAGSGAEGERLVAVEAVALPGWLVHPGAGPDCGGYGLILRDFAGQLSIEEEAARKARRESTGTLAGGLAHDFGNILTIAASSIALARLRRGDDSELSGLMAEAEHAVFRARNLTEQLMTLSMSGIPAARVSSIVEIVSSVAARVGEESGIGIEVSAPFSPPLAILDRGQMELALENILRYSVGSMPEGGAIDIGIEEVSAGTEDTAWVRMSLSDEGPGIPEEHLDRIFDPYTMNRRDGAGLGLATSHSVICRHGGSVSVASVLGEGTTFTVMLPAVRAPEEQVWPDAGGAGPASSRSGRVLVMDEDSGVLETTSRLLRAIGFEVSCAANGAQALEMCRRTIAEGGSYDAVIMDPGLRGEGGDGEEALHRLREACPDVRAIAASAGSESAEGERGSIAGRGFDAYLRKPYSVGELLEVLGRSCGSEGPATDPGEAGSGCP